MRHRDKSSYTTSEAMPRRSLCSLSYSRHRIPAYSPSSTNLNLSTSTPFISTTELLSATKARSLEDREHLTKLPSLKSFLLSWPLTFSPRWLQALTICPYRRVTAAIGSWAFRVRSHHVPVTIGKGSDNTVKKTHSLELSSISNPIDMPQTGIKRTVLLRILALIQREDSQLEMEVRGADSGLGISLLELCFIALLKMFPTSIRPLVVNLMAI